MASRNIETLLKIYDICARTLYPVLDGIPEEQLNWRPAPESRSIGQIIRHLIRVDRWFLERQGYAPDISDPGEVGPAELLQALQNTHAQIRAVLESIPDDAALARKSTAPNAGPHETLAEVVVHIAQHYLYHLAQVIYLRRAQDRSWKAPLRDWEEATYVLSDELGVIKQLFSR